MPDDKNKRPWKLNAARVRELHEDIGIQGAELNFKMYGDLTNVLMLYSDTEVLSIMEGPVERPEQPEPGIVLIPGAMRDNQHVIKRLIDAGGFTTAVTVGEFWGYPKETSEEDINRLYEGTGPSPGEHPNRIEGAYVITMSPMHRTTIATIYKIDRSGDKPQLVDPVTTDESKEGTMITGWLEQLLPLGSKTGDDDHG